MDATGVGETQEFIPDAITFKHSSDTHYRLAANVRSIVRLADFLTNIMHVVNYVNDFIVANRRAVVRLFDEGKEANGFTDSRLPIEVDLVGRPSQIADVGVDSQIARAALLSNEA